MDEGPQVFTIPEHQITHLLHHLQRTVSGRTYSYRLEEIRSIVAQLLELWAIYQRGETAPTRKNYEERVDGKTPRAGRGSDLRHRWGELVPGSLVARAYNVLPWGILVVSAHGRVIYYNRAYARLRHLPLGALLGQPLKALDRRRRLWELLRTGTLHPEPPVPHNRRANQEIIIPMWEGDQLSGGVVVVMPAGEQPDVVQTWVQDSHA